MPSLQAKFATYYNLKRHLVQHQKSNNKVNCVLPSCDLKFSKIDNVFHHAVAAHDADIKKEHLNFENENEFNKYLEEQEAATNTRFVKKRQPKFNKVLKHYSLCVTGITLVNHIQNDLRHLKEKRKTKKGNAKSMDSALPECM